MKACLCFYTYASSIDSPRHAYAVQSLTSILMQLTYARGDLLYHLADDGSDPDHLQSLISLCNKYGVEPTYSVSKRLGYGGNVNIASQTVHNIADFVLPCEDDWELVRHFDLSDLAKVLEANAGVDCIRLGYLGWQNELKGSLVQVEGQSFLLLDQYCNEPFIFAGHPRLETVDFERRVGSWPEGLKAGYTEMEVCKRPEARQGIAWPLDAGVNASQDYCSTFAHVGEIQA